MPEKTLPGSNTPPGTDADWSTLVGRAIDDVSRIIHSEIGLFETTLRAAVEGQTDYALANLATVAIMICGAVCMLGALILLSINGCNGGRLWRSRAARRLLLGLRSVQRRAGESQFGSANKGTQREIAAGGA